MLNFISRNHKFMAVMAVAMLIGVAAASAYGQETATRTKLKDKERSFCTGGNWSNGSDKVANGVK